MQKKFNYFLSPGFFIACTAAYLSIALGLVYLIAYTGSVYLNVWGVVLPLLSGVAYGLLIISKHTRRFAAPAMLVLAFIGFMVFINATYLYLSEVFFDGISAEAFARINIAYVFCVVAYAIIIILSNVSTYLRTDARQAKAAPQIKPEVKEESKA